MPIQDALFHEDCNEGKKRRGTHLPTTLRPEDRISFALLWHFVMLTGFLS
jgi:hypothetical protein